MNGRINRYAFLVYIKNGAETFKPENPIVVVEVQLVTPVITLEETDKITTIQLATPVIHKDVA